MITINGFQLKFAGLMKLCKCFGHQHFSATKRDTWHCDLNTLYAFGAALRRHLLNCEKWWGVNCDTKHNTTKQHLLHLAEDNPHLQFLFRACAKFNPIVLLFFWGSPPPPTPHAPCPSRPLMAIDTLSSRHVPLSGGSQRCQWAWEWVSEWSTF